MDFFKSVFSDDLEHSDSPEPQTDDVSDPHPNPNPNAAWSFGVLIKTLASKSDSAIQTYRRDIEEFGSGLRKETAVIREAASRAVKDLPGSLEVGASVAQESLETVGQAIDDIGSSVWKSTAGIISHGRESLLAVNLDSDLSENDNDSNTNTANRSLDSRPYSRFDAQLHAIQCDTNTYGEEPEDLDEYNKWKLGLELEEKEKEIENLMKENGVIGEIYDRIVPSDVDRQSFWSRYFYRAHKLKQAEEARARLVKRAILDEDEEDLSWDVDGDEEEGGNGFNASGNSSGNVDLGKKVENAESSVKIENEESGGGGGDEEVAVRFTEKVGSEGKADSADSDVSVVSSQPSFPEVEELGWDEIGDAGSSDDNHKDSGSSSGRADLRKRLSTAEEEEDLSWDIEDEDEPVKL